VQSRTNLGLDFRGQVTYSKRRRNDVQPIRRDLTERLRPWVEDKAADEPVFATMPDKTAKMLRADLAAAGIAYRDDAGRVVDFHALRHTFITSVVSGGATVKVAQELARHSTPTLTIGIYAHVGLHDLSAALDALPDTDAPGEETAALRATGTDDATVDDDAQRHLKCHQRAHESVRSDATQHDEDDEARESADERKRLRLAKDSDATRRPAKRSDNAPPRTRTWNPRIKSPLLCQLS